MGRCCLDGYVALGWIWIAPDPRMVTTKGAQAYVLPLSSFPERWKVDLEVWSRHSAIEATSHRGEKLGAQGRGFEPRSGLGTFFAFVQRSQR